MTVTDHRAGALLGILLLLPITMAVMGLIVLVPVLPQIMAEFHDVPGHEALIGLMLTLPALCVALLSPIAGVIVDFFGRRKTLIGSLVLYALAGVMPIFLNDLFAIIASRVALGTMEALVVISSTTLIGDYFHGHEREKWLANQTAVASIASVLLAFLGGALGQMGWRGPFAAYGFSLILAIGILIFTWEPRKSEQPADEIIGEKAPFPWGAILPIAAIAVFGGTLFFAMQIQVSTVLADYYAVTDAGQLGMFSALAGFCVAAGTLAYRFYTSRLTISRQLTIAFLLLGVTYVAFNYTSSIPTFSVALIINQLGGGMLLPALVVWAMGKLPFEVRGRGTGIFFSAWWIGQPLSTQIITLLRGEMGGNLPAVLQILGVLGLIAAGIALFARPQGSHAPAAPTLH